MKNLNIYKLIRFSLVAGILFVAQSVSAQGLPTNGPVIISPGIYNAQTAPVIMSPGIYAATEAPTIMSPGVYQNNPGMVNPSMYPPYNGYNSYYSGTPTIMSPGVYQNQPQYPTYQNGTYTTIVTTGSNTVTSNSANLVGSWNTQTGGSTVTWFEYGVSPVAFGGTTIARTQNTFSGTFTESITGLASNTIYYYRAVGQTNGNVSYGITRSFRSGSILSNSTQSPLINVVRADTTRPVATISTNGSTNIDTRYQNICPSDTVDYTLNYKNTSGGSVSNAVLVIALPDEIDYVNSSARAEYSERNHTVTIFVGSMTKDQVGTVYLTGRANSGAVDRDTISTRVDFTFVKANGQSETITNYVFHSGRDCANTLGAFALGAGFLPNSFLGWLLIVILICTIVFLSRKFFVKKEVHHASHQEHQDH